MIVYVIRDEFGAALMRETLDSAKDAADDLIESGSSQGNVDIEAWDTTSDDWSYSEVVLRHEDGQWHTFAEGVGWVLWTPELAKVRQ